MTWGLGLGFQMTASIRAVHMQFPHALCKRQARAQHDLSVSSQASDSWGLPEARIQSSLWDLKCNVISESDNYSMVGQYCWSCFIDLLYLETGGVCLFCVWFLYFYFYFLISRLDPKTTWELLEQPYSLLEKLTEFALGMCKRVFFVLWNNP